jgi:hypothetical protein
VAGELYSQPPYIQLYIYGRRPYTGWHNQSHFNRIIKAQELNKPTCSLDDYTRVFAGIAYQNSLSRRPNPEIFVIFGGHSDILNQGSERPGTDGVSQPKGYMCLYKVKDGNKYPWAPKKYIKLELALTGDCSVS